MKSFSKLDCKKQNEIRRKYKKEWSKEYKYSIHLFILYTILGIIAILGLIISFKDLFLGMLIFTLAFILDLIVLYFLYNSNKSFYKFLNKIGYKK